MTNTQFDVRGQDYSQIILPLARQEKSKLADKVYLKSGVTGKNFYQDQIGRWTMTAKTSANPDTPQNDPNLSRTRVDIQSFADSRMFDRTLEMQQFADPMSEVSMCMQSAIGLTLDQIIINALGGTAYRGETGATSVVLPSASKVAVGTTGMTVDKIAEAAEIMNAAGVPMGDRCLAINAGQLTQLLNETEATSSDYMQVKSLVKGEIDTFYGFNVVTLEDDLLPVVSTTAYAYAFHKTGLCLAMVEELFMRAEERPDKSYSKQVYYEINAGAARLEEVKVVEIATLTTA
jgi:hypothetical protein